MVSKKMRKKAPAFADSGQELEAEIMTFDMQGHGYSEGARGTVISFEDMAEASRAEQAQFLRIKIASSGNRGYERMPLLNAMGSGLHIRGFTLGDPCLDACLHLSWNSGGPGVFHAPDLRGTRG